MNRSSHRHGILGWLLLWGRLSLIPTRQWERGLGTISRVRAIIRLRWERGGVVASWTGRVARVVHMLLRSAGSSRVVVRLALSGRTGGGTLRSLLWVGAVLLGRRALRRSLLRIGVVLLRGRTLALRGSLLWIGSVGLSRGALRIGAIRLGRGCIGRVGAVILCNRRRNELGLNHWQTGVDGTGGAGSGLFDRCGPNTSTTDGIDDGVQEDDIIVDER